MYSKLSLVPIMFDNMNPEMVKEGGHAGVEGGGQVVLEA